MSRSPVQRKTASAGKKGRSSPRTAGGKSADASARARKKGDELSDELTAGAPTPRKEGHKNLAQRAEWFQRRSGSKSG